MKRFSILLMSWVLLILWVLAPAACFLDRAGKKDEATVGTGGMGGKDGTHDGGASEAGGTAGKDGTHDGGASETGGMAGQDGTHDGGASETGGMAGQDGAHDGGAPDVDTDVDGAAGSGGGGGDPTHGLGKYRYRRRLMIRANTDLPDGYSVYLDFDHASVVSSGNSLSSGHDVRIAWWDGTTWNERDRVLGLESSWGQVATRLWFRPVGPVEAGQDQTYYLYYGDATVGPPPDEPSEVFLFFDDFESGLDAWKQSNDHDHWALARDQFHSGSTSLKAGPYNDRRLSVIFAKGVNTDNVALDAYWRLSTINAMDVAQGFRGNASKMSWYESNFESENPRGWNIAKLISNEWEEITNQPKGQNPQPRVWTRITTSIVGTEMTVHRDNQLIVPKSGKTEVGNELSTGTVLFRIWHLPSDEAWWIDDVRVRKLVRPEPEVQVGPEEQAPFDPL